MLGVLGAAHPRGRELVSGLPGGSPLVALGLLLLAAAFVLRLRRRPAGAAEKGSASAGGAAIIRAGADLEALLPEAGQLPIHELAARLDALIEQNLFPVYEAQ